MARLSHRNIRVLGNFGYADRIQKYSFLLSINDTSSRKLRQVRADSRLALRLLIAVTKHRRDPRNFKLIDIKKFTSLRRKGGLKR